MNLGAAFLKGFFQGFLFPLGLWGLLALWIYTGQHFIKDPIRGLDWIVSVYMVGPLVGMSHWIFILALRDAQALAPPSFHRGIMIGGVMGSGICWLGPGVLCYLNVGI